MICQVCKKDYLALINKDVWRNKTWHTIKVCSGCEPSVKRKRYNYVKGWPKGYKKRPPTIKNRIITVLAYLHHEKITKFHKIDMPRFETRMSDVNYTIKLMKEKGWIVSKELGCKAYYKPTFKLRVSHEFIHEEESVSNSNTKVREEESTDMSKLLTCWKKERMFSAQENRAIRRYSSGISEGKTPYPYRRKKESKRTWSKGDLFT